MKFKKTLLALIAAAIAIPVGYCEMQAQKRETACLNEKEALKAMLGIATSAQIEKQALRVKLACGKNASIKKVRATWV